jgi:hypothetical protein
MYWKDIFLEFFIFENTLEKRVKTGYDYCPLFTILTVQGHWKNHFSMYSKFVKK